MQDTIQCVSQSINPNIHTGIEMIPILFPLNCSPLLILTRWFLLTVPGSGPKSVRIFPNTSCSGLTLLYFSLVFPIQNTSLTSQLVNNDNEDIIMNLGGFIVTFIYAVYF